MCSIYRPVSYTLTVVRRWLPRKPNLIVGFFSTNCVADAFQAEMKLKKRAAGHSPRAFVNSKHVLVEGGSGGDGCIAFERVFCNAKVGPSGGDGGHGGHVILQASNEIPDLSHIPSIVRADDGARGCGDNCHGSCAKHIYLKVPVGTQIYLIPEPAYLSESGSGTVVSDAPSPIALLSEDDAVFVAAHGGSGGKGNAFLTNAAHVTGVGSTPEGRNPPMRVAERGARGERRRLLLRMTRLAQLGLVGAPNAGKSTLLRSLTRARPKVAPYPFTTLKPHLGVIKIRDPTDDALVKDHSANIHQSDEKLRLDQVTVADLPGLIAGATKYNKGLGAQFLSLIADCQWLAFVIDVGTLWLSVRGETQADRIGKLTDQIVQQLVMLQHELDTFDASLVKQSKSLLIGTKMDLVVPPDFKPGTKNSLWQVVKRAIVEAALGTELIDSSHTDRVLLLSARRGDNVNALIDLVRKNVR
ncbi:GTPase obg [Fasciolopsis buskii]|uniref:GTPase obg n=1 Tax=Fasciolopsis buskii TaxID=27845 RepID=A0A8E0S2R9_9TREM|nr:GTPase obg [Fasciolopsis buski]